MHPLNPAQIILLFVVGQGLFLGITLFSLKRGDKKANQYLSIAVLLMTFFTFVFFLNDSGYRRYIPILIINGYSIEMVIPVMFYFYFKQITNNTIGKYPYLHFIPFLIQFLYWLPNNTSGLFHTLDPETFDTYYSQTIVRSVSGVHIVIFVIYNYLFFKEINFDKESLGVEKRKWLVKMRTLYTLMTIFFALCLFSLWTIAETNTIRYVFFYFLSAFIYIMGYYGYTKSTLFAAPSEPKPKYYHSKLTKEESQEIYKRLLSLMTQQKPYLNPEVKIADLAESLDTSANHLSQVINENYGQNFLDFVNKYRIEEAQRILSDESGMSLKMLAVALDSGFSNKVSFYKNFKKFTGVLPSEFKYQSNSPSSTEVLN